MRNALSGQRARLAKISLMVSRPRRYMRNRHPSEMRVRAEKISRNHIRGN